MAVARAGPDTPGFFRQRDADEMALLLGSTLPGQVFE
jgi:hypothetical protein